MSTNNMQLLEPLLPELARAHPLLVLGGLVALHVMTMLVRPVIRLLDERQRRITLEHIYDRAPGGSAVVQTPRRGGRTETHLWVGAGDRARQQPVIHVHHVLVHHRIEPQGVDGRHDPT